MVVTEEEHLPSDRQQDEAMIVTEDNCLPPYAVLSGEELEQITLAVTSPLQPMFSTEMSPSVRDDGSMMDLAERDQHQARLKRGLLKTDMKLKPYVKARGRPKHNHSTLWPLRNKKKKQCSEKENQENQNSDELLMLNGCVLINQVLRNMHKQKQLLIFDDTKIETKEKRILCTFT